MTRPTHSCNFQLTLIERIFGFPCHCRQHNQSGTTFNSGGDGYNYNGRSVAIATSTTWTTPCMATSVDNPAASPRSGQQLTTQARGCPGNWEMPARPGRRTDFVNTDFSSSSSRAASQRYGFELPRRVLQPLQSHTVRHALQDTALRLRRRQLTVNNPRLSNWRSSFFLKRRSPWASCPLGTFERVEIVSGTAKPCLSKHRLNQRFLNLIIGSWR